MDEHYLDIKDTPKQNQFSVRFRTPLLRYRSHLISFNKCNDDLYSSVILFFMRFGTTCVMKSATLKLKKLQESREQ